MTRTRARHTEGEREREGGKKNQRRRTPSLALKEPIELLGICCTSEESSSSGREAKYRMRSMTLMAVSTFLDSSLEMRLEGSEGDGQKLW